MSQRPEREDYSLGPPAARCCWKRRGFGACLQTAAFAPAGGPVPAPSESGSLATSFHLGIFSRNPPSFGHRRVFLRRLILYLYFSWTFSTVSRDRAQSHPYQVPTEQLFQNFKLLLDFPFRVIATKKNSVRINGAFKSPVATNKKKVFTYKRRYSML